MDLGRLERGFARVHAQEVNRQNAASLVDTGRKMPAVMEHRLGDPLVGKILQQGVDKGQNRIRRQRTASGNFLLQAAKNGRGIGHSHQRTRPVGEIKGRQQFNRRLGHTGLVCCIAHQVAVGNVSVTHERQHLACVGRTGSALERQWQLRHLRSKPATRRSAPPGAQPQ